MESVPTAAKAAPDDSALATARIERRRVLSGLISEYRRAA
jgi:hypothetical protein